MSLHLVLVIVAIIAFAAATVNLRTSVNLVALGLLAFILAQLV